MKQQLTSIALAAALGLAALSSAQAEGLSYNIGAVSLYKSNGIDQDDRGDKSFNPAIQGGVDYDFGNGFYVGNWNSTGKFGNANLEIDIYAGYAGNITEDLGFDIGLVRYVYPNSGGGWNGNDAYFGLSYGAFSAKYYQGVSGSVDKNKYLTLGVELPISETVTFNASVGWSNPNGPSNSFNDYSLGVSYDLGDDLAATVAVAGATKRAITGNAGKGRLILGISKSF